MTVALAWVGLGIAVFALARYGGDLVALARPATWPEETPLNPHDNRARDPHLAHLGRLLASDNLAEAHRELVSITEQLLSSGSVVLFRGSAETARERLGPDVAAFLDHPPLGDPDRYRRRLAEVLVTIEAL